MLNMNLGQFSRFNSVKTHTFIMTTEEEIPIVKEVATTGDSLLDEATGLTDGMVSHESLTGATVHQGTVSITSYIEPADDSPETGMLPTQMATGHGITVL